MKKSIILVATVIIAAALSAIAYAGSRQDDAFVENLEALDSAPEYPCPGGCLTWSGSTGGGLDCQCQRYSGRCKRWCDAIN